VLVPTAPAFVSYCSNSGHRMELFPMSAFDDLRHWRFAGTVVGWGLHPLENAALSRRTP
jgi:hypothetical protein